ncbi:hypothetical protein [Kitasatospora sp. NPDC057223]|uniref:hypothetical protein n=1 Tax=Kitasatospora sp. NPDC057223 TaxID=3346055 RepID=UPI0036458D17
MRTRDVEIGETYIASIPQRLPQELRRPGESAEQWRANMQLHLVRGRRITVTVTALGDQPDTVIVSRDIPAGRVALRLTAEQGAALDLAKGQEYEIDGIVRDAHGRAIVFPTTVFHTIPARWLHPADEQLVLQPDTEHFHRALVCRNADGMTPAEIDRAAEKALAQLHHVRGLTLEDPNVDHSVLTSEADHREWLRTAHLAAYDPRADPDAVVLSQ